MLPLTLTIVYNLLSYIYDKLKKRYWDTDPDSGGEVVRGLEEYDGYGGEEQHSVVNVFELSRLGGVPGHGETFYNVLSQTQASSN